LISRGSVNLDLTFLARSLIASRLIAAAYTAQLQCVSDRIADRDFTHSVAPDRWGGNARYVFSDDASLARLDAAINATVTRNVADPSTDNSARATGPSSVLHLRADRDLDHTWVTFGSEYVKQRIVQAAVNQRQYDVATFFSLACPGVGLNVMESFRGDSWESFVCHMVLRNGGTFAARSLRRPTKGSSSQEFNVTLPKSPLIPPFGNVTDIRGGLDGVYYQPLFRNFTAVDSVRQPCDLYQITNAKEKKAPEAAGLLEAAKQLRGDNITLYWVVPRRHFDTFTARNIAVGALNASDAATVQQIEQVVLAVEDDLEELRRQMLANSDKAAQ
jgi:hypothetical protein